MANAEPLIPFEATKGDREPDPGNAGEGMENADPFCVCARLYFFAAIPLVRHFGEYASA